MAYNQGENHRKQKRAICPLLLFLREYQGANRDRIRGECFALYKEKGVEMRKIGIKVDRKFVDRTPEE